MNPSSSNTDLKITLIGNPNAGKSTLFNGLTGLKQKTGNYSGVTIDSFEGSYNFNQKKVSVIDLPGLYSLYPKSADELISCKQLLNENQNLDAVVLVMDATNLKRSLLLATQVIDLKFKTVIALNMIDEALKQGIHIEINGLSDALGVSVIPIDSRHGRGFEELKIAIENAKASNSIFYNLQSNEILKHGSYKEFICSSLEQNNESQSEENADKIYRFKTINYLISKFVRTPEQLSQKIKTNKIDSIVTHKYLGYGVLLLVLFLVFQFIFFISETPMNWIEQGFILFGNFIHTILPSGEINDLLVNGVIAGVSGVVMFVPQIAFLFLFIGVLEDSGYMARASFIMDRIMRPFGLNGNSVIPLISATACAVPSIMATRTIKNLKERTITIFIMPLISCSARLPVYTLLISVLYPGENFLGIFNTKGLVLFLLYFIGFAVALITAFVLKKFIKTKESSFFIMELPVYRRPQMKSISILIFNKVKIFVFEAGKIILAISVVLWFLSSHGGSEKFKSLHQRQKTLNENSKLNTEEILELNKINSQKIECSYIGTVGHAIEPAIAPLGFDWKIGIALITSFAAREVFVGTMATIYQNSDSKNDEGIKQKLLLETNSNGNKKYTASVCWSLLFFYTFALQCMSTVAVVRRETKSNWLVFGQFIFMTALAYGSSFLAFRIL